MKIRLLLPLGLFLALVVFLVAGLQRNPRDIPSPLIGKRAPSFTLPRLQDPKQTFAPQNMLGKVWLLNVWASWCTACQAEHPLWFTLSKKGILVAGLNYKDQKESAISWLQQFGDPYVVSIGDEEGLVGMEYGVYGVPETFVIDQKGIVRYKQIGPLTPEVLENTLYPLIKKLQSEIKGV